MEKQLKKKIILASVLFLVQLISVLIIFSILNLCTGSFNSVEQIPSTCSNPLLVSLPMFISFTLGLLAVVFALVVLIKNTTKDKYRKNLILMTIGEILLPILFMFILYVQIESPSSEAGVIMGVWAILTILLLLLYPIICIIKIVKKDYIYTIILILNVSFLMAFFIALFLFLQFLALAGG